MRLPDNLKKSKGHYKTTLKRVQNLKSRYRNNNLQQVFLQKCSKFNKFNNLIWNKGNYMETSQGQI